MIRPRGEAAGPRRATATALVRVSAQTVEMIRRGGIAAGNVIEVARIAAIAAAKQAAMIVPLHRGVRVDAVDVEFRPHKEGILIWTAVEANDRCGVETEALAAASVAALTVCDMCRPIQPDAAIGEVRLDHGAPRPQASAPGAQASVPGPQAGAPGPQAAPQEPALAEPPRTTAEIIRSSDWPARTAPRRLRRASQRRGHMKRRKPRPDRGSS
jgi:cyclic pyranopterin phosphate synthase